VSFVQAVPFPRSTERTGRGSAPFCAGKKKSRTGGAFPILLCACLALALTGFTAPGRTGVDDASGVDAIALVKIALRGGALVLLALLVLRLNFHRRATAVLGRFLPMGLFALWTVTTVLWSPLRVMSFGHALEVAMLTALGVCAAIVADSGRKLERLCLGFFLLMSAACAVVMALDSPAILAGARPIGYMHPNSLAALGGVALVILLASRLLMGWTWSRRLLIPGVLVCTTAIFVARSRTGIMATLFVTGVLLLLFGRRAAALLLLIACGGLFAFMPYIGAFENLDQKAAAYFLRGQTREDLMSASGRDEVWAVALNSAREAPLFGHGYYSMSDSGKVYVWGKEQVQTAHDVYLHVLTGTGAIGLALFLWGLAALIFPLIGSAIRSRNRIAILALGVILWQLIGTLFEVGIIGPIDAVTVSFFAIGGAAVGSALNESCSPEASPCAS